MSDSVDPDFWIGLATKSLDKPADSAPAWVALEKENRELHRKQQAAYETAVFGVVTSALDRAKNSVSVVQAASAALLAIYTGMLGFVYAATDQSLPFLAIATPLFLGAAVLFSTYYTSFISPYVRRTGDPYSRPPFIDEGSPDKQTIGRINAYVNYVGTIIGRRAWALRAAVAALAVGLVALPLPFVQSPAETANDPVGIAVALPTAPPDSVPEDMRAAYFEAQIEEAQAQAEEERVQASRRRENPLNPWAWLVLVGGALLVFAVTIPSIVAWLRQTRAAAEPKNPAPVADDSRAVPPG